MHSQIETSHFDTGALAPDQRFDAWRDAIGVCFDVTPHDDATRERFTASVDSFLLDDIVVNHCRLGAQTFERSAARIARDGIDHYQFHVFLDGAVEMDCAGRPKRARRGDFVVLDHGETFASRTTDYEILNIFIPRRRLAALLNAPDSAHGTVFDSRTGAGRLLNDFAAALFRAAPSLTTDQAPDAAQSLIHLCAMALNGAVVDRSDPPSAADRSLLLQAQLVIKDSLHDPSLRVETVAAAIGVSRSRLYAIFEPIGGVAEYVREMRLRRAYAELISARARHRSVAEIAYSLGYSDPCVFSRAFKARFGCAPREARETAASCPARQPGGRHEGAGDVKYAFWIGNIA